MPGGQSPQKNFWNWIFGSGQQSQRQPAPPADGPQADPADPGAPPPDQERPPPSGQDQDQPPPQQPPGPNHGDGK
jgi:hypothetical protein